MMHTRLLLFSILSIILLGCNPANQANATNTPNPTSTTTQEYWQTEPRSRDNYAVIDVENDSKIPMIEFRKQYAAAMKNKESWVENPIDVGLHFSGYPNVDHTNPDKVFVYYLKGKVVVTIISEGLMDDSIRDQEKRIDLVYKKDAWMIEWAGYRQRCIRNSFDGWVTKPCP